MTADTAKAENGLTVADILRPLVETGDERFAALRTGFPFIDDWSGGNHEGIRTDLGSIVRAAAACGLWFGELGLEGDSWVAVLLTADEDYTTRAGPTPEHAAARALRAACEALGIMTSGEGSSGPSR